MYRTPRPKVALTTGDSNDLSPRERERETEREKEMAQLCTQPPPTAIDSAPLSLIYCFLLVLFLQI